MLKSTFEYKANLQNLAFALVQAVAFLIIFNVFFLCQKMPEQQNQYKKLGF